MKANKAETKGKSDSPEVKPQAAVTAKAEFKYIPLDCIVESPLNPRKNFDSGELKELSDSIRTSGGVIHPILLRPLAGKDGKYQIVAGSRRYRATKAIGLTVIASTIRELNDEQALEVMIMENLERKDVHPMEEAAGIKQLLEMNGYTLQEIETRLGKSHKFVAQRIKLNDLSPDWQKAFYQNRLSMNDALKICKLSPDSMAALWKESGSKEGQITINEYTIRKYLNDLSKAPFDTADPTLNKKMGACGTCQFNSAANSLLFPGEAKQSICTNSECFRTKVNNGYMKRVEEAKVANDVVFVVEQYGLQKETETALKGLTGAEAILTRNDFSTVDAPDFEEVLEDETDNYCYDKDIDGEDDLTEKDKAAIQKEAEARFNKEKAEYEKKVSTGKFQKAFVADGNNKGQFIYIEIEKKATKKAAAAGATAAEHPSVVIKNIQEREKRYKELDASKVYKDVYGKIEKAKYTDKVEALIDDEMKALAIILIGKLGYGYRDKVKKALGWESGYRDNRLFVTMKGKFDLKKFNRLVRYVVLQEAACPESSDSSHLTNDIDAALFATAQHFIPKEVKAAEAAQKEVSDKRQANQVKKIQKLREEMKKPAEPKGKSTGVKIPVKKVVKK